MTGSDLTVVMLGRPRGAGPAARAPRRSAAERSAVTDVRFGRGGWSLAIAGQAGQAAACKRDLGSQDKGPRGQAGGVNDCEGFGTNQEPGAPCVPPYSAVLIRWTVTGHSYACVRGRGGAGDETWPASRSAASGQRVAAGIVPSETRSIRRASLTGHFLKPVSRRLTYPFPRRPRAFARSPWDQRLERLKSTTAFMSRRVPKMRTLSQGALAIQVPRPGGDPWFPKWELKG